MLSHTTPPGNVHISSRLQYICARESCLYFSHHRDSYRVNYKVIICDLAPSAGDETSPWEEGVPIKIFKSRNTVMFKKLDFIYPGKVD